MNVEGTGIVELWGKHDENGSLSLVVLSSAGLSTAKVELGTAVADAVDRLGDDCVDVLDALSSAEAGLLLEMTFGAAVGTVYAIDMAVLQLLGLNAETGIVLE